MQHPTTRRSFITAGSLGFLGLSLREILSAAAAADSPPNGKAKAVILFLARRRSQPHRYVGPEVEQQLQAHLH